MRTRALPWKPKVIQSKTLKLLRLASFFCTSLAMRKVSSCDQVGEGLILGEEVGSRESQDEGGGENRQGPAA